MAKATSISVPLMLTGQQAKLLKGTARLLLTYIDWQLGSNHIEQRLKVKTEVYNMRKLLDG